MPLKIDMEDLFYGFILNYWTFGIRLDTKTDTWTHNILGYFARLGQMLGFVIEYEWKRYDLVWFRDIYRRLEDKPILHIEHENHPLRLPNLFEKVVSSEAPSIIAVGYPLNADAHNQFVKEIENLHRRLDKEFMFIVDPAIYDRWDAPIIGYVARPRSKALKQLEANRFEAPDGTYYATNWILDKAYNEDEKD